jgi:hypothetical protein
MCAPAFARWAVEIFNGKLPHVVKEIYFEN